MYLVVILVLLVLAHMQESGITSRSSKLSASTASEPTLPTTFSVEQGRAKHETQMICKLLETTDTLSYRFDMSKAKLVKSSIGFNIYVYAENDVVSNDIKKSGAYQPQNVEVIRQALELFTKHGKVDPKDAYLLDIGVNVGFMSLSIAALGYNVIGFEALFENSILVRASICNNPGFHDKVTLFGKGLAARNMHCSIYAGKGNVGDGQVLCHIAGEVEYQNDNGNVVRGEFDTVRLDDVLDDSSVISKIGVVKMDVEGYEPYVIDGGYQTIIKSKVPVIIIEIQNNLIKLAGSDPAKFVKQFLDAGYVFCQNGLSGCNVKTYESYANILENRGLDQILVHSDYLQLYNLN